MKTTARELQVKKKIIIASAAAVGLGVLAACSSDAEVASENLSKAADNFEVNRRIVMFNGITNDYLLTVEGACSIEDEGNQLEVICKDPAGGFEKHFLGLSDNVSYFVEQGRPVSVSANHYRVVFKPQTLVPDFDARGGTDDLPREQQ
jgi:hypothetical protein